MAGIRLKPATNEAKRKRQRQLRARFDAYRSLRRGRMRRLPRVAVPSFFTLMNLLCGFGAIVQINEGRFDYACWLIAFAGFFDLLDGMMARLTNSASLFGVQLDSLSDIVSFGIAPSFLVFEFGLRQFNLLGFIVSALPALCGAVRLARFNINVELEGEKPAFFSGLPIPVQALTLVALILNFDEAASFNQFSLNNMSLLIPTVSLLGGLMISNIPFDAFPRPSAAYIRAHPYKTSAVLVALVLIIVLQQIGLLIAILAYLGTGLYNGAVRLWIALENANGGANNEAE